MTRAAASAAVVVCALLLAACAAFTPGNPLLAKYAPDAGYRFERLERGDNSDELFVIVTFSGGGTRAAALAYGVLEALRDTTIQWRGRQVTLLDEVDVISSISGGSFPAAYYALYGRRIFDEFPDKFLYRPIQSDLAGLLFSPASWLKLSAPSFGRSDLAAEFYHREVFGGGTYADVIARGRRPFVILNATDMTTGTPFPFIQDQFHLTDGGVADNIGLRGPLAAITSTENAWSVLRMINEGKVEKLVVIAVNAANDPATDRDRTPSVPGILDTLTTAANVPLDNYSFDTLELLSASVNEFNEAARLVDGCEKLSARKGPQCALDVPAPRRIELFPVQVAFEYLGSAEERAWFKNLPTVFELPRETIDKLRAAGRRLLAEDPQFKSLLKSLNGCLPGSELGC